MPRTQLRRASRLRAFTLVELIVVILVLALLAAVAVVGYAAITDRAHDAKAQAHVRQFQTAIMATATLDDAPALSRQVLIDALARHFPGGVAAGTTAAQEGWGLLRVDDASPDASTFAAGFDTGAQTVASDSPGTRAAVVLHSDSGRSVAAIMNWEPAPGEPQLCSGYVADGITPRMVLAGRTDAAACIDPALLAPPTPTGLRFTVHQTADGNVLDWDSDEIPADALTDGAIEIRRDGEWVATVPAGTDTWTDPAGDPGAEYTVTPRPATAPVASSGAVRVTWPTSAGPVNVWRDGEKISTGNTTGELVDTGADAGDQYVVVVAPDGQEREAVPATTAAVPAPPSPGGQDATPQISVSEGTFTLAWDAVASTARAPLTGYRLYRQPADGTTWDASSRVWEGTAVTASDAPAGGPGSRWCYRVSAYGPGGESGLSGPACATVDTSGQPVNVLAAVATTMPTTYAFGADVATSGNVMVVADPYGGTLSKGAIVTYERIDGRWQQTSILNRPASSTGRFGQSVAMSGNTLVVGSPQSNRGQILIYTRAAAGAPWTLDSTFGDPTGSDGFFGWDVDVDGDHVATRSGTGYSNIAVYKRTAGVWRQQAELTAGRQLTGIPDFVTALLLKDGALYVGTGSRDVTVFTWSGTAWTRAQILAKPVGGNGTFGRSLAVDGNTLAVGISPGGATDTNGGAIVYTGTPGTYTEQARLIGDSPNGLHNAGLTVALSGNRLLVGAPGNTTEAGWVYEYSRSGSTWSRPTVHNNPDAAASGFGLSLSADNGHFLVGAKNRLYTLQ